jgi:hypothetical protein
VPNGFREVIALRVQPGRALAVLVLGLGPASLLAILIADLGGGAKLIAVFLAVIATLLEALALRHARLEEATLMADGRWMLGAVEAELLRAWGVSLGPVLALEWRCRDDRNRRAWLLRCDVGDRDWRRLRARLRLGRIGPAAAPRQ